MIILWRESTESEDGDVHEQREGEQCRCVEDVPGDRASEAVASGIESPVFAPPVVLVVSRRDAALFVGLAAVWGTAFVATKAALASVPPLILAAVRFDVAAVVLLAVAVARGDRVVPRRADWPPILAGGGLTIGLHHALLFTGQVTVTSAAASVLLGLIPVLTPALARLAPGSTSRLGATGVVGLAVGFLGVVLMAVPTPLAAAGSPAAALATARTALAGDTAGAGVGGSPLGVALVLGSAVAFALGAVFTREARATLSPVAIQAWMAAVGAASLHAAAIVVGQGVGDATWTPAAVAWLAYLAVIPGAGGFFLYFRLLERLGPVRMGTIEYAIPPFAAGFGWAVLGESTSPSTVAGFLAVIVAFALVNRSAVRRLVGRRATDARA
jgi:drug/metabolite transporter (DMT)-like permease